MKPSNQITHEETTFIHISQRTANRESVPSTHSQRENIDICEVLGKFEETTVHAIESLRLDHYGVVVLPVTRNSQATTQCLSMPRRRLWVRVLITVIWECWRWLCFWFPSRRPEVNCSYHILAPLIFISINDLHDISISTVYRRISQGSLPRVYWYGACEYSCAVQCVPHSYRCF